MKSYNKYIQTPLIKLIIPFICGILLGIYNSSIEIATFSLFIGLTFFISIIFHLIFKNFKQKTLLKILVSPILILLFFIVGYNLSSFHKQANYHNHYKHYVNPKGKSSFQIKLLKQPIEKTKSYKIIASIQKINVRNQVYKTDGKVMIYLQKTEVIKDLKIGDRLNINSRINKITGPKNPNEFNYRNYLLYQNIDFQAYVRDTEWHRVTANKKLSFINYINLVKKKLQGIINTNIFNENERAIASALLLGNRTLLNEDILNAFSSSGATHILAVSGLHVGIFYTLISFSLSWMLGFKKLRSIHPILTILAIWFYVLLTGASPSVMRAATIFTFYAVAKSFQRHFSVYNIIAFSAFILISIDPFIVTEVGFQLSYIAVIGIIYIQPKLYKQLVFKNYLLDKVWAITAVSIAAQISTVPLIVLYFHQFPNLFWISNLIVIPAAAIILYGGILLFTFSWNSFLSALIGNVLSYIILYLNKSLQIIENIPFALSKDLYISHFQAILIYLFIIWFSVSLAKRSKKLLNYSLVVLMILSISFSLKYKETKSQKYLTVYHTPKASAIEIINGNSSYSLIDTILLTDKSQMLFRIKHNWWEKSIHKFKKIKTERIKEYKVATFEKNKILFINEKVAYNKIPINVDFVILSNMDKLKMKNLTQNLKAKTFIFDCSNKTWKNKYWQKECEELGINCYFVSDSTAFVAKL